MGKLIELFKNCKDLISKKDLQKVKKNGNIIEAEKYFKEKRRQDEWWEKALNRVNNIDRPNKEES